MSRASGSDKHIMSIAAELGVDERARALLETLPQVGQEAILQKLSVAMETGEVRNPSAYVASQCKKPAAFGIDDRASDMLNKLDPIRQKAILDQLKVKTDIKNPSAWVVKQILKEGQTPMALSPLAQPLPSQFPGRPQQQIRWEMQWVPVIEQAPMPVMKGYGKAGKGMPMAVKGGYSPYGALSSYAPVAAAAPQARMMPRKGLGKAKDSGAAGFLPALDAAANRLLSQLAPADKQEILDRLKNETNIRNPSAWAAKQAMSMGASPSAEVRAIDSIDDQARNLFESLPAEKQEELAAKLEAEKDSIRNPSAWVAKNAMAAGAGPGASSMGQKGGQKGGASRGPPRGGPAAAALDDRAKELLVSLPFANQTEILNTLEEMYANGTCRNPSAWVAKASMNAGARKGVVATY